MKQKELYCLTCNHSGKMHSMSSRFCHTSNCGCEAFRPTSNLEGEELMFVSNCHESSYRKEVINGEYWNFCSECGKVCELIINPSLQEVNAGEELEID